MATQVEVVYPSIAAFNSNLLLSFGPYSSGFVNKLLRAEVNGRINYQAVAIGGASVEANFQMWGLQWVSHGSPALDPVTAPDGRQWLMREQVSGGNTRAAWAPNTATADSLRCDGVHGKWAGQLLIVDNLDLYLVMRAPTGVVIDNMNFFGSIRWWWV